MPFPVPVLRGPLRISFLLSIISINFLEFTILLYCTIIKSTTSFTQSTGGICLAGKSYRIRLSPAVGRPVHHPAGRRHRHFLHGGAAVHGGHLVHLPHPSFAGAAVPGYDRRRVREKARQGRPFLLPDAGHFHRHPRGHGQSGGRGGCCFCRRCRCGVLDVGHCYSGCVHLLYRIHPCPEIPPARPAVRRLARRACLLPACAGRAQARQKAPAFGVRGAVCRVRPHLLVRHQSGHLQLGELCV